MLESSNEEFVDCRSYLLSDMAIAKERYEKGKEASEKKTLYERELATIDIKIAELTETANHMTDIYKNVKSYAIKHQERSKELLRLAVEEAARLVPDADVEGIHLKQTENNRVIVVNGEGHGVNRREGGGIRTIIGALLRYASLKAQPDALQLMLFDEQFFTLSDTTSLLMKDVFEAMKKDMTIICIEQRRNAMDGIADYEFTFKKGLDKNSTVTRTL